MGWKEKKNSQIKTGTLHSINMPVVYMKPIWP